MNEIRTDGPVTEGAPEPTPLSDHSLLERYVGGSEDAATQLYQRYAERLNALVRTRCSSDLTRRVDADDIIQSAFRSFFRAAHTGVYEAPDGEDLWRLLLTITLNKVRAQGAFHRAAKRDIRLTASLSSEPAGGTVFRHDEEGNRLRLALEEAIAGLPNELRPLVEFRLRGHEVAEIAGLVGRSKRTVERGLQRALASLRTTLEEDLRG